MKPLLPRDRAASAVPARSSLARIGAWARESLLARGLAALAGLCVLAAIGRTAVARSTADPNGAPISADGSPSPANPAATTAPSTGVDAGAIPTTRPELLPRTPPGPASPAAAAAEVNPPEPSNGSATSSVTRATPDDPVDLNTARVDDLRRLPGVGAKRAEAVLALRARLPGGRFKHLEDLLKVKGIGRAMLKRLHPLVRLSGVEAPAG